MERASGSFVRYGNDADNPQSLRDSDVMALYQDRGGVLWVGTRSGGASHWNPDSWRLGHYRSAAFRDTQVSSFADDGGGTGVGGNDRRRPHRDRHAHRAPSAAMHMTPPACD